MNNTVTIRIKYSDYKKLRQVFPAKRNETIIAYISRFVEWVQENKI